MTVALQYKETNMWDNTTEQAVLDALKNKVHHDKFIALNLPTSIDHDGICEHLIELYTLRGEIDHDDICDCVRAPWLSFIGDNIEYELPKYVLTQFRSHISVTPKAFSPADVLARLDHRVKEGLAYQYRDW